MPDLKVQRSPSRSPHQFYTRPALQTPVQFGLSPSSFSPTKSSTRARKSGSASPKRASPKRSSPPQVTSRCPSSPAGLTRSTAMTHIEASTPFASRVAPGPSRTPTRPRGDNDLSRRMPDALAFPSLGSNSPAIPKPPFALRRRADGIGRATHGQISGFSAPGKEAVKRGGEDMDVDDGQLKDLPARRRGEDSSLLTAREQVSGFSTLGKDPARAGGGEDMDVDADDGEQRENLPRRLFLGRNTAHAPYGLGLHKSRKVQSMDNLTLHTSRVIDSPFGYNESLQAPAPQPTAFMRAKSALSKEMSSSPPGKDLSSSPNRAANDSGVAFPEDDSDSDDEQPGEASGSVLSPLKHSLTAPSVSSSSFRTPQNFKHVKPLQTAFMSTGLVSKRSRPRQVEPGLPVPFTGVRVVGSQPSMRRVSLGSGPSHSPAHPSLGSSLGLREVVASVNAHAVAAAAGASVGGFGKTPVPPTMPDTPVKKAVAPTVPGSHQTTSFAIQHPPGSSLKHPPLAIATTTPSPSPLAGPPAALSDVDSTPSSCESPTLNVVSLSELQRSRGNSPQPPASRPGSANRNNLLLRSQLGLHRKSSFSSLAGGESSSPSNRLLSRGEGDRHDTGDLSPTPFSTGARFTDFRLGQSSHPRAAKAPASAPPKDLGAHVGLGISAGSPFSAAAADVPASCPPCKSRSGPAARMLLHRKSSGALNIRLERGESFDLVPGVHGGSISVQPPLEDGEPMTPTRAVVPIKWFEGTPTSTASPFQEATPPGPEQPEAPSRSHLSPPSSEARPSKRLHPGPLYRASNPMLGKTAREQAEMEDRRARAGRFESEFFLLESLGKGEFSEALKVQERATGKLYAVKKMKSPFLGPRDRLRRLEEVDILRHLSNPNHENIVSLIDAWEEQGVLHIQTELCQLGTLAMFLDEYGSLVERLDEARVWKILVELSAGLKHIHDHDILHLDLKPANVFVTEMGSLKIGDFGLAARWPPVAPAQILEGAGIAATQSCSAPNLDALVTGGRRRSGVKANLEREGDREYIAPEILRGKYSEAADIFSLGLIILEAATNIVLPDNGPAWHKLRTDDFSDVEMGGLSEPLVSLVKNLLHSDAAKRPMIDDVCAHPVVHKASERMARELGADEVDQLPTFESGSPPCAPAQVPKLGRSDDDVTATEDDDEGDWEMTDNEADPLPPGEPEPASFESALGLSGMTDLTNSSPLIPPSPPHHLTRGSLIAEPDDFLEEILAAADFEEEHHDETRLEELRF